MEDIDRYLEFVKEQIGFHSRQAERLKHDKRRFTLHKHTADTFEEIYNYLKNPPSKLDTLTIDGDSLSLKWSEVQDLPPELLEELSITDSDKLDYSIVGLMEKLGGIATLDRILVDVYKLTGEVLKRSSLNARLYRMTQKSMIYSVEGRKGVYSTTKIDKDQLPKLARESEE